ncbi:hypothetical protein [Sphingobium xenophagum]|uniref:hypothetical protein n=1 Tax=Sphingobium xenophagum TaxID=121428 RepID=UPI00035C9A86|nr:hypothetical protein [Sphingobium xenophagum]
MTRLGYGFGRGARGPANARPEALWRLATVRGGESAYGIGNVSTPNSARTSGRIRDMLSNAHITALRYADAAFIIGSDQAETAVSPQSIQRALEIGPAVGRVTWSGSAIGTIPGGALLWSDDLLPGALGLSEFPPGVMVWHRSMKDNLVGDTRANFPMTGPGTPEGEDQRGTTIGVDRLMQTGALPADGGARAQIDGAPGVLIGLAKDHGPTVLVCGDSRFYGVSGNAGPGTGTAGGPPRMALEQAGIPHAMQARSGSKIQDFVAGDFAKPVLRIGIIAHVSDILCNWSVNDMSSGRTASQILGDIAAFVAKAKAINPQVRIWWTTMAPSTNGSNIPVGLYANSANDGRQTFNNEVRTNFAAYGLSGLVDISAAVEDPTQTDRWADFANDSSDGLHSRQTGQVKEAAVIKAWADALPAPLAAY